MFHFDRYLLYIGTNPKCRNLAKHERYCGFLRAINVQIALGGGIFGVPFIWQHLPAVITPGWSKDLQSFNGVVVFCSPATNSLSSGVHISLIFPFYLKWSSLRWPPQIVRNFQNFSWFSSFPGVYFTTFDCSFPEALFRKLNGNCRLQEEHLHGLVPWTLRMCFASTSLVKKSSFLEALHLGVTSLEWYRAWFLRLLGDGNALAIRCFHCHFPTLASLPRLYTRHHFQVLCRLVAILSILVHLLNGVRVVSFLSM